MHSVEKKQSRLQVPEFRERVFGHLLDVLTEHMTNPVNSFMYPDPNMVVEKIKRGEKIDELTLLGATVVAGQDLRLSPDEIDELKGLIFENSPKRLVDR